MRQMDLLRGNDEWIARLFMATCVAFVPGLLFGCSSDDDSEVGGRGGEQRKLSDSEAEDAAMRDDTAEKPGANDSRGPDGMTDSADTTTEPPSLTVVEESEPNDGGSDGEFQAISPNTAVEGIIETSDTDLYKLNADPLAFFTAKLVVSPGSELEGHLLVFDTGRGGDRPGDAYRKAALASSAPRVTFPVFGDGGYYLAVRDRRNLEREAGKGGADFEYRLEVTKTKKSEFSRSPLQFSKDTITGELAYPGEPAIYPFDGEEGQKVQIALEARDSSFDGRLVVVSERTGSWIARNDDRAVDNKNPLVRGPLPTGGPLFLLVENLAPEAEDLGFELTATTPGD